MARQVTLSDVEIQHIMINHINEVAEDPNVGSLIGYSCTVQYTIRDENGNKVTVEESQKYTSGTPYPDNTKLSSASDTLVMDFVNAISVSMNAKEEL